MSKLHVRYKGPKGGIKTLGEYLKLNKKQQKKHKKIQWFE